MLDVEKVLNDDRRTVEDQYIQLETGLSEESKSLLDLEEKPANELQEYAASKWGFLKNLNINDAFNQTDSHPFSLPPIPKTRPQLVELCRTKLTSARKAIEVLKNDAQAKDKDKMVGLIQDRIKELEDAEAKLLGKDEKKSEDKSQNWKTVTYAVRKKKKDKADHKCIAKEYANQDEAKKHLSKVTGILVSEGGIVDRNGK